jgi:putative cell wall binding repeat protein
MPGKRPINADLPPAEAPAKAPRATSEKATPPPPPPAPGQRRPVPVALKAIGGLILVAVVFLVAAVLGGGGSNEGGEPAPAPTQATPEKTTEAEKTPTAEAAEELGYPSFATNNTTRVGGSDPAAIAAGVSLAVFPSITAAQRPTAVTLVDEEDWQGAVAAAVLMAEPLRSPLLISADGELPEPTTQALAALAPQGNADSGDAQAFVIGEAAAPGDLQAARIVASGPAALATAIASKRDRLFGRPPSHFVLVPEAQPEFAIPAAAWAARSGDPILFSGERKLPAATAKALERHPKVPVFVLGPSSAISSGVVREVTEIGPRVRRVSGEDPVANAIALARYASGDFGWNVNDPGHGFVVARDDAPLDAAVAAPLSASGTWGPLLLSDDADTLPAALREYLLDVKPGYTTDPTRAFYNHVWVIGDQEAISVTQQAVIDELAELAKIGGEP